MRHNYHFPALSLSIVGFAVLTTGCAQTANTSAEFNYLIGRGITDITGPAAGVPMFGFAKPEQTTAGIHLRLKSRAFIIADPKSKTRLAFVCPDLGSAPHEIQREVVDRLQQKIPDTYTLANVIISATHTHSGPGGYWHYGVDSPLSGKFYQDHFDAIVDGIVNSILAAHEDLAPGNVRIARGQLENAGAQRSAPAYLNNPEEERARYHADTDKTMTLLKLSRPAGPIAALNWFPVHPTAMTYNNHLISGDHKGCAATLFENKQSADDKQFVAAFANSNCGDVTANLNLDNTGPGKDQFDTTRIIAERQYHKAVELFATAAEQIEGPIATVQTYVDFACLEVRDEFTHAGPQRTCPSAYGYAFAAGSTEDGGGHPLFKEGMTHRVPLIDMQLKQMIAPPPDDFRPCHLPKVILFATGAADPPAQSQVLPLSIAKIGQLAIVAVPGEITTMAGRRLRDTVAAKLAPVVKHVVIAAYSNDYAGYITTKQEYDTQQYEGGHTLYGPWTLTGYQQEFARLAQALAAGSTIAADTTPRDLRGQVESTPLGTPYDATPENAAIGDLVEDAHEKYTKGDQVTVTFWSTHLQNGFSTDRRYLDVQLKTGNAWTTVAADEDWSTKLIWKPIDSDAHTAQATITWDIPNDAQPGTYRIRHHLVAKSQSDGKINASIATSREFNIE